MRSILHRSLANGYEWQIDVWVEAANSGKYNSTHEIASKVFGKPKPRADLKDKITYPFLTHDTLRAYVDWNFKDKLIPGPSKIGSNSQLEDGDSIWVKTDGSNSFVSTILKMNKSFILVTGNSDHPSSFLTNSDQLLKSPLLISWYAQNPDAAHPKLKALPIGLENKLWGGLGDPEKLLKTVQPFVPIFSPSNKDNTKRIILSYINFTPRPQAPERGNALKVLSNISHVTVQRLDHVNYVADLKSSKFTVSPPGNGWDCLRTWESVLFGSIPIVLHSPYFSHLYELIPVMVVKNWTEVTKEKLEMFKVNKTGRDTLLVDFWLDKIQEDKQKWMEEQLRNL